MECIVHYSGLESSSKLKPESLTNEEAILEAKSTRDSISVAIEQQCNNMQTQKASASLGMLLEVHMSEQGDSRGKE